MIDPSNPLPVTQQCRLLDLSRSSVYYKPKPIPEKDLVLMRRLDELHLERPAMGQRGLRDLLRQEGYKINRKKVQRLMQVMRIHPIYPKPKLSLGDKQHTVYPYLLRDLLIDRPNQVWATDITYIPMAKGFLYLTVILDWYSRKVLSWRLSNTLDADFCVEALNEAVGRYGAPEIVNTDQGSQYTSDAFTKAVKDCGAKISMDGKGRWIDNRFVERLWRSVKYEEVYLKAYDNGWVAEREPGKYFDFYNLIRPHRTFNGQTPDQVYFGATKTRPEENQAA